MLAGFFGDVRSRYKNMGVSVFGDLAKPALDVLGDDYTKKFLLKVSLFSRRSESPFVS